ncbi:hypothetical protein F5879DRAFT_994370 [Lentinula edodes]|nr:hypothetical protein F5879DRAFT_994370 [Lentinula edodes]
MPPKTRAQSRANSEENTFFTTAQLFAPFSPRRRNRGFGPATVPTTSTLPEAMEEEEQFEYSTLYTSDGQPVQVLTPRRGQPPVVAPARGRSITRIDSPILQAIACRTGKQPQHRANSQSPYDPPPHFDLDAGDHNDQDPPVDPDDPGADNNNPDNDELDDDSGSLPRGEPGAPGGPGGPGGPHSPISPDIPNEQRVMLELLSGFKGSIETLVKELEVFDSSDPQKLKMFFINLALVFNDRPKYFTDQWKVNYTLSYLSGSAKECPCKRAPGQFRSTSIRKNLHLTTTLLHQQGLVDESNALATCQHRLVEQLQEEVHRARDRAVFVDQMIKEYPDEGYYEVILPPLSQLEGDLNKAHEDLHRIATFAHCLYRSDPVTVLHHHYHYIGVIIEAVVAFLHRGPDSDDLNTVIHYFRLALDYMQAARGVHGDIDGAGRWDDIVPALPSIDQLTADWEQLMLQYIHHITNTPLPGLNTPAPMSSVDPVTEPLGEMIVEQSLEAPVAPVSTPSVGSHPQVPLFLPEQESPTFPSPPPPSPTLPPLFGSIANLAIDLTGDDDELYETEESHVGWISVTREVVDLAAVKGIVKEE